MHRTFLIFYFNGVTNGCSSRRFFLVLSDWQSLTDCYSSLRIGGSYLELNSLSLLDFTKLGLRMTWNTYSHILTVNRKIIFFFKLNNGSSGELGQKVLEFETSGIDPRHHDSKSGGAGTVITLGEILGLFCLVRLILFTNTILSLSLIFLFWYCKKKSLKFNIND